MIKRISKTLRKDAERLIKNTLKREFKEWFSTLKDYGLIPIKKRFNFFIFELQELINGNEDNGKILVSGYWEYENELYDIKTRIIEDVKSESLTTLINALNDSLEVEDYFNNFYVDDIKEILGDDFYNKVTNNINDSFISWEFEGLNLEEDILDLKKVETREDFLNETEDSILSLVSSNELDIKLSYLCYNTDFFKRYTHGIDFKEIDKDLKEVVTEELKSRINKNLITINYFKNEVKELEGKNNKINEVLNNEI